MWKKPTINNEQKDDWEDNLLPHVGVQEDESREDVDSSHSCPHVADIILNVTVQPLGSIIEEDNGDDRANDDHEERTVAAISDRIYEEVRSQERLPSNNPGPQHCQ